MESNRVTILFLFLMQTFEETEQKWAEEWGRDSPEYCFLQIKTAERGGHLLGQPTQMIRTLFDLIYQLYIDDNAFLFTTKLDLITGMEKLFDHLALFGLQMHIGCNQCVPPKVSQKRKLYKKQDLNKKPAVKNGFITWTNKFRYTLVLGSIRTCVTNMKSIVKLMKHRHKLVLSGLSSVTH